jgi:hypothetical protein
MSVVRPGATLAIADELRFGNPGVADGDTCQVGGKDQPPVLRLENRHLHGGRHGRHGRRHR